MQDDESDDLDCDEAISDFTLFDEIDGEDFYYKGHLVAHISGTFVNKLYVVDGYEFDFGKDEKRDFLTSLVMYFHQIL